MSDTPNFHIICDGGSLGNHTGNGHGYGSWQISMFNAQATMPPFAKATREDYGPGVTNSEAEYRALIGAFKHIYDAFSVAAADHKKIKITVNTDSQMIIGHLTKHWKIKPSLTPLVTKAAHYCQAFGHVDFIHMPGDEMKSILGH